MNEDDDEKQELLDLLLKVGVRISIEDELKKMEDLDKEPDEQLIDMLKSRLGS